MWEMALENNICVSAENCKCQMIFLANYKKNTELLLPWFGFTFYLFNLNNRFTLKSHRFFHLITFGLL